VFFVAPPYEAKGDNRHAQAKGQGVFMVCKPQQGPHRIPYAQTNDKSGDTGADLDQYFNYSSKNSIAQGLTGLLVAV
jgi:hypothetical protein